MINAAKSESAYSSLKGIILTTPTNDKKMQVVNKFIKNIVFPSVTGLFTQQTDGKLQVNPNN
jgi:hypothetical protein